ncbi:hypothetical protein QQZ08_004944 [Neonectria magnoliae]|uniref:Uncharacterized protein n=1 Tax=Neonectria magnoliae TaxID=2732573 RepID=A0ABR1I6R7_9HYPO
MGTTLSTTRNAHSKNPRKPAPSSNAVPMSLIDATRGRRHRRLYNRIRCRLGTERTASLPLPACSVGDIVVDMGCLAAEASMMMGAQEDGGEDAEMPMIVITPPTEYKERFETLIKPGHPSVATRRRIL